MRRWAVAALLVLWAASAIAAPARVQGGTSVDAVSCSGSSIASATVTIGASGAGNLLSGTVTWGDASTTTLASVTDNKSSTYTIQSRVAIAGDSQSGAIFWTNNTVSGITTVTVNFSPSVAFVRAVVDEYSGVDITATPLDNTQFNLRADLATANPTTANITTVVNGDLIYAGLLDATGGSGGTITAGSGFGLDTLGTGTCNVASEHQVQGAAASIAGAFTAGSSDYIIGVMAFKASGGAPPVVLHYLPMLGVGQ